MMTLLAHHVEIYHIPILAALFGVGCWLGWSLLSGRRVNKEDR
jgi:hypothetical protein